MTPAEHYAEAERLVDAIVEACAPGEIDVQAQASIIAMGILGNIHATLATVPVFPEKRIVERAIGMVPSDVDAYCTCPRLEHQPLARTSVDADCPIHGAR